MGRTALSKHDQSSAVRRHSGQQTSVSASVAKADQSRVWLVLGDKQGDNRQVEVVADALGWAYERKRITMREPFVRSKPRVSPSLHHIERSKSDALEQPWPDLIITIGRRPSMVALWIREQSAGHTKIVLIGKPSGRVEWYDLVVASREIVLPPLPNVVTIALPLMQIDEAILVDAAARWRPHFSKLPRPLIGILIGGPTIPFVYKKLLVRRLLQVARDLVRNSGGTPYITTSRRTPAWAAQALQDGLPAGGRLFCWTPEAEDNPYTGLLALADGFVVTGDSISMIVEAIKAGKPVAILSVPAGATGTLDQLRRRLVRWLFSAEFQGEKSGFRQATGRLLYRLRVATHTRDFRAFHKHLYDLGLAVPANQGVLPTPSKLPSDVSRVVARIKALVSAE